MRRGVAHAGRPGRAVRGANATGRGRRTARARRGKGASGGVRLPQGVGAAGRLGDFSPGDEAPVGSPSPLWTALGGAGGLVWLLLALGAATVAAVAGAVVRQRRAHQ